MKYKNDLHRTGCSLFCGAAGRDNQAVLRRVLLGFARWNKSVGYCQGLNVLAALVLQVTDRAEASAVKVMIYLVEGVLPEGYFADNLRGLSVDMAVFRDLLRMRLPKLSRHLEVLQCDTKDKTAGSNYEPPLTNVFTMQWFLTLFCHCLPQDTVFRVWDLIFLEGDEVLLRTALAIWEGISDRIMSVTSADEFYSIMGVLTREMLEFTDTNNLIKMIVNMGPLNGVTELREKHRYNITPWARRLSDDDDTDTDDDEKLAVAAAMFDVPQRDKKDRRSLTSGTIQTINSTGDKDKLALDISTLKQQYVKLRERQRQAHIILSAACARQTIVSSSASQAMNHLLVGKSALVSAKTRKLGAALGTMPPKTRIALNYSPRNQIRRDKQDVTLHWKDTKKSKETKNEPAVTDEGDSEPIKSLEDISISLNSSTLSLSRRGSADSDSDSTSTELCDEPDRFSDSEELTSTSDYYVMATDDEKSSHQSNSPILSGNISTRSLRKSANELSLSKKDDDEGIIEAGTSESIAEITDQIRRLSADEDSNLLKAYSASKASENFIDIDPMNNSETFIKKNFLREVGDSEENLEKQRLGDKHFVDSDNALEVNFNENTDNQLALFSDSYIVSSTEEEIPFSPNEKYYKSIPTNVIDDEKNTNTLGNCTKINDDIEFKYSSSQSLDIPSGIETKSHTKVPISVRSNTLDSTIAYSYVSQSDNTKLNNIETIFNSKSYVIGHIPISPITIDKKISELSDKKVPFDQLTPLNTKSENLNTETKIMTYKSNVPELLLDYNSRNLTNVHPRKTIPSPKTPESTLSASSGETMGPDSKVSSISTTPHTPLTSELCKLPADNSACSSVSSESKTLTLMSVDSNDFGQLRSKLDSRSDVTKRSFDKSTPSTPISTDSLKNKSELMSPLKLMISSSSDSYNTSPGIIKNSETSFSSGLQSPISANSIKYTANYIGHDNISESPVSASLATSPFYPISNPNQKSPSPNRTLTKPTSTMDYDNNTLEKITLSTEPTNIITYPFVEMPKVFKAPSVDIIKIKKSNDDYDSARPFETELAETLSSTRLKSDKDLASGIDGEQLPSKIDKIIFNSDIQERLSETGDTVSPLPRGKYDNRLPTNLSVCKIVDTNDDNYSFAKIRDSTKLFERSCSSLDKHFSEMKLSTSSEDFLSSKKRSSDILPDLRHLEANSIESTTKVQIADTIMIRKTGYDWEDLKNLEARRQDNFSDSASEFSKYRLDIPSISVSADGRKSYIVEPKIQIDANSDSILKNYTQKKNNGELDDDNESKVGVWTKVKPRKIGENGRRSSSDRALKIIQENSVILHKILTCQAKKCLPDLEEMSKEITISPINEEISKIFSPILEKMGLNEHEINEELARINLKDFDQMTITSGSEFDAKINDELSKLSLIDESEGIRHQLDVDEMIEDDYLNTREALIDKQINEELSKLLANYEHKTSPISQQSTRDQGSLSQNPSEIEALDLSSISTNVFSYQSSNDSIETKSDLGSIHDPVIVQTENFPQYTETGNVTQNFDVNSIKYELENLSPKSDIDIYRELEKLDKISTARVFPSFTTSSDAVQTLISSNVYTTKSPTSFSHVQQSTIEYSTEPEKSFQISPLKSPHHVAYKPYDFQVSTTSPKISSSSSNLFSRSYQVSSLQDEIEFNERTNVGVSTSRNYEHEVKRKILTKENLEFRIKYDDKNLSDQQIQNDSFPIESYQSELSNLNRGASYYANESPTTLKRLTNDNDEESFNSTVSSLNYPSSRSIDLYTRKFVSKSPVADDYVYSKSLSSNDYEKKNYQLTNDQVESSYIAPLRREIHSHSPNYEFVGREFTASTKNSYTSAKLSPNLEFAGAAESIPSVTSSEFVNDPDLQKYPEVLDSIAYRKASMTLGPLDTGNKLYTGTFNETPSPKSQFYPFPVKTTLRRPKELGLKLGLYSPSNAGSIDQSKKS
ncbi:hypothetical protein PV326_002569 [Microctonus aethiopoides]|nr:hypothetical protein PV326_002569 [Microctonus aethiopoides]